MNSINLPKSLPGELGLWLFIASDLVVFGLYFISYAHDFAVDKASFMAGQATLLRTIGLVNTLLLITGSWSVAVGLNSTDINPRRASAYFWGGALTGAAFLCLKWTEYVHLFRAGHSMTESLFYTWYFVLTAFHAFHVVIGVALLGILASLLRRKSIRIKRAYGEIVGCYWHMVDIIWILLFSILYVA